MELLKELRMMAEKYNKKMELRRKKLIKKYEVKIINALRRNALSTGKIAITILVPEHIYLDIMDLFKNKGFTVTFVGFYGHDSNAKLVIKDN